MPPSIPFKPTRHEPVRRAVPDLSLRTGLPRVLKKSTVFWQKKIQEGLPRGPVHAVTSQKFLPLN